MIPRRTLHRGRAGLGRMRRAWHRLVPGFRG